MPDSNSVSPPLASPDYSDLIRFLVTPFLESPDSLRLDCEVSPRTLRVLIRLAVEGEDKGRIFGRGGRNIQAIRTVLQAAAQAAGQTAYLEIFGSQPSREDGADEKPAVRSRRPPRPRSR